MLQHIGGAERPNIKNHLQEPSKPAAVNTHQLDLSLKDARTRIDVQSEEIQVKKIDIFEIQEKFDANFNHRRKLRISSEILLHKK